MFAADDSGERGFYRLYLVRGSESVGTQNLREGTEGLDAQLGEASLRDPKKQKLWQLFDCSVYGPNSSPHVQQLVELGETPGGGQAGALDGVETELVGHLDGHGKTLLAGCDDDGDVRSASIRRWRLL